MSCELIMSYRGDPNAQKIIYLTASPIALTNYIALVLANRISNTTNGYNFTTRQEGVLARTFIDTYANLGKWVRVDVLREGYATYRMTATFATTQATHTVTFSEPLPALRILNGARNYGYDDDWLYFNNMEVYHPDDRAGFLDAGLTSNAVRWVHDASPSVYYHIRAGRSLTGDTAVVGLVPHSTNIFQSGTLSATNSTLFLRSEAQSIFDPADVDGDGMDDVFEYTYDNQLDPLYPYDATQDPDGDWVANLLEYWTWGHPGNRYLPYPRRAISREYSVFRSYDYDRGAVSREFSVFRSYTYHRSAVSREISVLYTNAIE